MTLRRAVIGLLVFLILGAIVNVGVAFVLVSFTDPTRQLRPSFDGAVSVSDHEERVRRGFTCWQVTAWTSIGRIHIHSNWQLGGGGFGVSGDVERFVDTLPMDFPTSIQPGLHHVIDELGHYAPAYDTILDGGGWPAIVLAGTARNYHPQYYVSYTTNPLTADSRPLPGPPLSQKRGFESWDAWLKDPPPRPAALAPLPPGTPNAGHQDHPTLHFPHRVIWRGFAINTVFYAFLLWLLFSFPGLARRYIRRTYGHCPRCGYDLRTNLGTGCPECGWRRRDENTAAEEAVSP